MARNVAATKRGWGYDTANSRLNLYVDGVELVRFSSAFDLAGSSAVNAIDLRMEDSTTMSSGYAHGIHLKYEKDGTTSGGASLTQYNAIGIDYTIKAGNATGFSGFYLWLQQESTTSLSTSQVQGCYLEMNELGATDYFSCLRLNKYNTTKGTAVDAFILCGNQGSGVTRSLIFMQGTGLPDYFLEHSADSGGYLDAGTGASASVNGHILVRTSAGSKYLRLYASAS